MGGTQINNQGQNIVLNEQNQNIDIIEYEGYEDFPIVEMPNSKTNKQDKIKLNPSLNNHSGGSSIGKFESGNDMNKLRDKHREDKKDNEEEIKNVRNESKFHNSQCEDIKKEKEEKENNNINNDNKDDNNKEMINNNENKEKNEEDIKNEVKNGNINNPVKEGENRDEEENKEKKEENGNNNMNIEENVAKEKNINNMNNEEQIQEQKEENNLNNISNGKNMQQFNINENTDKNENKENTNMSNNANINNNENINKNNKNEEKKNENKKNEEFSPKKIVLPDINTIISEKVLEEGAGNELLFMSNLNKMVHISIKERVKYSEKFCITTKDNFLIYETRENYIKVKKPLAIIPINSIKNVVLFKLTKKVINYDHFYVEFQLDENIRNNVYNQIETFYINDLDNNNNENKSDTALVLFKTEEKNLAKKWYVLLKYLAELKLKN